MDRNLEIIRTQFWIRSLLDCFGFQSVSELVNLSNCTKFKEKTQKKNSRCFYSCVQSVIHDTSLAEKAYKLLVLEPIDRSNWYAYYNGKQPITAKSGKGVSKVEEFGEIFPETASVYKNGPYNLLAMIECQFIGDAVEMFSFAVEDFHAENDIAKYYSHSRLIKGPYDRGFPGDITPEEARSSFDIYFNEGNLLEALKYYSCVVQRIYPQSMKSTAKLNDFLLLELAEKVIRANFFASGFNSLAREVGINQEEYLSTNRFRSSFTFCLDYIQKVYGIDKNLWIESYPIFKFSKKHWLKNKEILKEWHILQDADPWY